jgi:hypothetical protein
MNTLIHADIFFFVTTIFVVIIAIVMTIALIYLIKILHDVKTITKQVREETVLFREDIKDVRGTIRRDGFRVGQLFTLLKGIVKRKTSRSKAE